jgi:hypothetical protein
MSNRIDFFQSGQTGLSLAGATVSIFVDGLLRPYLELVEIVRGSWPEFGFARLAYNPAACADDDLTAAEEIEARLAIGKPVCILQVHKGCAPSASVFSFPIFVGQTEGIETRIDADGERIELIAKDFSAILKRISVYGQRVGNSDGSGMFLAGPDTVFNASGRANAGIAPIENNGSSYTVFCAEPSAGRLWSYAEVIDYLLCEYIPSGQLQRPSIERLRALTENQMVRDVDVTGLDLIDAFQRCCERIGLEFKFVPRHVPTGPQQAIVFYKVGRNRRVELNCQQPGEKVSISKTDIVRLHGKRDFWPVTHKYIGQGDFKVYEATFDLVKAWDPADEDINYDKFSPLPNPDFYKVRDVYRKWCLNEAGDYSGAPYNQGGGFDFSKVFESCNFVQRRRRFWPTLSTDKQGKSFGYYL